MQNDQTEKMTKKEQATENTVSFQTTSMVTHYPDSKSIDSNSTFPQIAGLTILEKLGEGGMGVVYRAQQERLQRVVAVKFIKAGNFHVEARERFKQETEAIARIKHPGIVQVFDVGDYQGEPYSILEYVAGGGLDQRIREELPDPRVTARLVEQLANALSEVHRMQIVHRDLKPANILVQGERNQSLESCQLKISDFGLAKFLGESDSELTKTGYALGTPNYMAPEQASGQAKYVTETADIYSLGAILYYLLTGRAPFRGASIPETLKQVLEREPTLPSRLKPQVPRDLEAICLRCLEKKSTNRYQSSGELAADLRRFQAGEPTLARPLSGSERAWRWIVRHPLQSALAAAAFLVIILAVTGASIAKLWVEADTARGHAVTAQKLEVEAKNNLAQITYFRQVDLALRDWQEGNVSRARKLLSDCEPKYRQWEWWHAANLCHREEVSFKEHSTYVTGLALSADGRKMLTSDESGCVRYWDCTTGTELYQWSNLGGQLQGIVFLPDEKRFAVNSTLGKMLIFDLSSKKCVQEVQEPGIGQLYSIALNKQGNKIAAGNTIGQVFIWSLDQKEKPVGKMIFQYNMPFNMAVHGLAFHPDNERLVVADKNVIRTFHINSQKEITSPLLQSQSEIWRINFDPTGKYLAFGNETGQLEVIEFETRQRVIRTGGHTSRIWDAVFHPTLPLIATGSMDQRIKLWDLNNAREIGVLRGHVDDVIKLFFDTQGDRLYSIGGREVRAWNWRESFSYRIMAENARTNQLMPLASAASSCMALVRSRFAKVDGPANKMVMLGPMQPYTCFSATDNPEEIVVARDDGSIEMISAQDGKSLRSWRVSNQGISNVTFVAPRKWVVTLDFAQVLQAFDLIKNQVVWKTTLSRENQFLFCCSSAGNWVATQEPDFQIGIRNLETGQIMRHLKGHANKIMSLSISPDEKSILSTSADISTRQWDVESGTNTRTFISQPNWILCAAYAPDGQRIATAYGDFTIKIWDTVSGGEVMTLKGHTDTVTVLTFSKDGEGLYSSGFDGTIRYWPASHNIKLPETVKYDLNSPKD